MQMGGIISDLNGGTVVCHFGDDERYYPTEGEPPGDADLDFILNAKADIAFLFSEIERMRREKGR